MPATAFFVPGSPAGVETERRYEQLRAVAAHGDARPERRRIFSLACRHAGSDCVVEVGKPFPGEGGEVLAIFALGDRQGFQVATAPPAPDIRLGRHVYTVTEFA